MSYIFLLIAILLFVIGFFIRIKRVTWLISGYNTLSDDKKAEYDIERLCKYMGNFVFILAAIWLVMTVCMFVLPQYIELITVLTIAFEGVAIVIGIIYLNTNNRVKK